MRWPTFPHLPTLLEAKVTPVGTLREGRGANHSCVQRLLHGVIEQAEIWHEFIGTLLMEELADSAFRVVHAEIECLPIALNKGAYPVLGIGPLLRFCGIPPQVWTHLSAIFQQCEARTWDRNALATQLPHKLFSQLPLVSYHD